MAKVIAVFGATGQQGSSVITSLLKDIELSRQFSIRAITRDASSPKAKALKETTNCDLVQVDQADYAVLAKALSGVYTVFAMTNPSFEPDALQQEYQAARDIADAAAASGVNYFIFSTLPSVHDLSQGRYTGVTGFEAKAKAERYIKALPLKSIFISLGLFMENFQINGYMAFKQTEDGSLVMQRNVPPQTRVPLLSATSDTGKFVSAILADPERFNGKTLHAAQGMYTLQEIVETMSKASQQDIGYEEVSVAEIEPRFGPITTMFAEAHACWAEFGYFGAETESLIASDSAFAGVSGLATFAEFLRSHPFQYSLGSGTFLGDRTNSR